MDAAVIVVFVVVYAGMIMGEIPGLALDRTGIALLGAIFLLAIGGISPKGAWEAIDVPTIALLLGLMVVSAQFRLGGFYTWVTRRIAEAEASPPALLALLVALAGILSALLANDVVCLAMAPVLIEGCAKRRLNPVPFLLGLACASNVGSAATLIGNPQNMLIGQVLHLSFARYLVEAGVPSAAGLAAVWSVISIQFRGKWEKQTSVPEVEAPSLDVWQSAKGMAVLAFLVASFLIAPMPREVLALAAAGVLLMSRRMASRDVLGLVDWQLLVLFIGLFVVNRVLDSSGVLGRVMGSLGAVGVDVKSPAWLFGAAVVLSNMISNVPAVMLLLPSASHPLSGPVLALASTLAGNLLIVGSIANIIVVEQARRMNVKISWAAHARTGVPVTSVTLILAAAWLWLMA